MKTLKFTTRFLAIASFSLISTLSIGQTLPTDSLQVISSEVETTSSETMETRDETTVDCTDKFGNTIVGTPGWSSFPEKIVTTSDCPANVKVGIQVMNPQANLHISSGLSQSAATDVLIIENNHEKILKLSNNGVMYSREIRVNLDQWPDYVFEEEYELISLDSLENYINKEGHLPNVPAAEAVENDGLNLGESNKFLMEKVEELTLYLIAQNKEQEQLKATLEEQQKLLQAQQELLIQQSLLIQQIVANLK